ncbi:MAG TPA: hypothetical protein VFU81_23295, partial [Thermomicrobiales bacterium]|nr:hypothetical protein [Thermomicrobiales bacterium]
MIATVNAPTSSAIRDQLLPGVRAGAAVANERDEPINIAIGVLPPAAIDPLALFAGAASWTDERFYWEQPSGAVATAALGVAAALETHGASRFADASAHAKRLFANLVRGGDDAAPVRLVGGFAFDPDG